MTRAQHLLACLCVAWIGTAAQAQVVRCTDPATGKVTYTDGKCAGGTTAREVEARKTPEEIQREREQAAEALALKQSARGREQGRRNRSPAQCAAERTPAAATTPVPLNAHARAATWTWC